MGKDNLSADAARAKEKSAGTPSANV